MPWLRRGEGGQAAVVFALALPAMLVGAGLAIDTGQLFVARRDAQAAADAGAWAGAVRLYAGATAAQAVAAARADVTANGFSTGGNVTVTVSSPPVSGAFAGDPLYVEVRITEEVMTSFLRGAASELSRVSVRAVGGAAPVAKGYAILTLSPNDPSAFLKQGNAALSVSGSGIMVNSSHSSEAAKIIGNGDIVLQAPSVTSVVGGVTESQNGEFIPAAATGATPATDPLRWLPEPDISGMPIYSNVRHEGGTVVLQPGVYDGGLTILGNASVTLGPGMYVFRGGGFSVSGTAGVSGAGVTLFNAQTAYPAHAGTCGAFTVTGTGALALSAPASGTYQGMLFWQHSECTQTLTVTGNGSATVASGTIYAPSAKVLISGNGTAAAAFDTQIVAKTFHAQGNAALAVNYDSSRVARNRAPSLVE